MLEESKRSGKKALENKVAERLDGTR